MSSVEADFDRLALLDEEGWTSNNHYHNLLLKHVPKNCENALEIGCGTGAFARELAKRCGRVVALDLSAEMIRVARSRATQFQNLEFQLADAMTWRFPQSHYDFICSIATLHHLEQRELFVKMRDALKPRGVLNAFCSVSGRPRWWTPGSKSRGWRFCQTVCRTRHGVHRSFNDGEPVRLS